MNYFQSAVIRYWCPKSMKSLSKELNVHESLLSKWMHGHIEVPLNRKIQISKLFKEDSRFLFPVEEEISREVVK